MTLALCDYDVESSAKTGAERRRGMRIAQDRPIKVLDATVNRYFGGRTCDVSATGLRIELPLHAPVRYGEVLNIHVGLSNTGEALANRRSMIPARVVWVDRPMSMVDMPKRKSLTVGVEFMSSISAHLDAA